MDADAARGQPGHTVDVIGPEVEGVPDVDLPAEIWRAYGERLLEQAAVNDGDRARRGVVIMPAGVVRGRPAQDPQVEVRVPVQADVVPCIVVEVDVRTPQ